MNHQQNFDAGTGFCKDKQMYLEIERKFIVPRWPLEEKGEGRRMQQGYLSDDPHRTVRVRRDGEEAFLTVKGFPKEGGRSRFEWERPISTEEAQALFPLCLPGVVDKTRWLVSHEGKMWEVDEYHGVLEGLVVAEVEMVSEEESISLPPWLGPEVTDDPVFTNARLRAVVAGEAPFPELPK